MINNKLTVECKAHFKRPIYCVCKSPYDALNPMISCDSCSEWYHFSCIGLRANAKQTSQYICDRCSKSSKAKIAEYRAQNVLKEARDTAISDASSCVKLLTDLTDTEWLSDCVDTVLQNASASGTKYAIENVLEVRDLIQQHNEVKAAAAKEAEEEGGIPVWSSSSLQVTKRWEAAFDEYIEAYLKYIDEFELLLIRLEVTFQTGKPHGDDNKNKSKKGNSVVVVPRGNKALFNRENLLNVFATKNTKGTATSLLEHIHILEDLSKTRFVLLESYELDVFVEIRANVVDRLSKFSEVKIYSTLPS